MSIKIKNTQQSKAKDVSHIIICLGDYLFVWLELLLVT